jgi:mycothiol synthase
MLEPEEMPVTTLTQFAARPYAGDADLPAIVELLNLCGAVDKLDESFDIEGVREELSGPEFDQTRDVQLWEDAGGRLAGYGQLWIPPDTEGGELVAGCWFRVHPDTRNQGLESEIIAWGSARVAAVAQERGVPGYIQSGLRYSTPEYIAYRHGVMEAHGFAPVRYFFRMVRPLDAPIPEPRFPTGYTPGHLANDDDIPRWTEAFNQSFIDHWDHHPLSEAQARHWLGSPKYQREGNLIAEAADGTLAAFCLCWIDPDDNARNNRLEGWISDLGTRRGHRKLGLGRAMLLAGMHWLKAQGMDTATLGVDAENPSGALRLYESVGFTVRHKTAMYRKAV